MCLSFGDMPDEFKEPKVYGLTVQSKILTKNINIIRLLINTQ